MSEELYTTLGSGAYGCVVRPVPPCRQHGHVLPGSHAHPSVSVSVPTVAKLVPSITDAAAELRMAARVRAVDPLSLFTLVPFPGWCEVSGKELGLQACVGGKYPPEVLTRLVMPYGGRAIRDVPPSSSSDGASASSGARNPARVLLDGLGALAYAGIVHQDISDTNIVVDEFGVLRLIDFGLARALGQDHDHDHDRPDDTDADADLVFGGPVRLTDETIHLFDVDVAYMVQTLCVWVEDAAPKDTLDKLDELLHRAHGPRVSDLHVNGQLGILWDAAWDPSVSRTAFRDRLGGALVVRPTRLRPSVSLDALQARAWTALAQCAGSDLYAAAFRPSRQSQAVDREWLAVITDVLTGTDMSTNDDALYALELVARHQRLLQQKWAAYAFILPVQTAIAMQMAGVARHPPVDPARLIAAMAVFYQTHSRVLRNSCFHPIMREAVEGNAFPEPLATVVEAALAMGDSDPEPTPEPGPGRGWGEDRDRHAITRLWEAALPDAIRTQSGPRPGPNSWFGSGSSGSRSGSGFSSGSGSGSGSGFSFGSGPGFFGALDVDSGSKQPRDLMLEGPGGMFDFLDEEEA